MKDSKLRLTVSRVRIPIFTFLATFSSSVSSKMSCHFRFFCSATAPTATARTFSGFSPKVSPSLEQYATVLSRKVLMRCRGFGFAKRMAFVSPSIENFFAASSPQTRSWRGNLVSSPRVTHVRQRLELQPEVSPAISDGIHPCRLWSTLTTSRKYVYR